MRASIRRRVGTAVVLALLSWRSPALAGEPCDPRPPLRDRATTLARASACYLARRLPDAVALYRAWLAPHAGDRAVRVELARLLSEAGDLAGAEAEYDRLLAGGGTGTDRRALHKARADVRAWRGALVPAIAEYEALVAADAGDAGAFLGLGLALQWSGRLGDAERALRAALAADPQRSDARQALAALLASPAHRALAADAERRAHPEDAGRWAVAVDAAAAAEQFALADTLLADARRRWPGDRRFRGRAATLRAERAARNAARVAAARAALAARPEDGEARTALAAALAEQGDFDAAITLYDAQLRRRPDDATTRRQLARTLSWAGRYGRALGVYEELVGAAPSDLELRLERASVLAWDGQLAESAREIAAARGAAPGRAERMLGDVYRWGGARAAAGRHYRAAVRLGGDDEDARAAAQALAAESGVAEGLPTFGAVQDSDGFRQRRVTVEARQRHGLATEVGAAIVHTDYAQHGVKLRADRGRFSLLRDLDDRWRLGAVWAPTVYDEDRTTHGATVELTRVLGPESQVGVAYDHYDLIDEVLTVASADRRVLSGHRLRAQGRHVLPGRLELAGAGSVSGYSDGNRLVALQASLARRVLRKPGVTVKADAGYLDYAERSDLYWDPARYLTQGLSAIVRQEIAPSVTLQLDARVGYGQEEGQGSLERSVGVGLALAEVAGLTAELGYRYGETGRVGSVGGGNGGGYVAHSGTIAVRYRFGAS
ncbi:MAG: tetratricopeptide repeat protein [Deltaproteobacteria bacterium]|nr:tetratricopeptide repeat protein [Deltaproteobacteria bacterium]